MAEAAKTHVTDLIFSVGEVAIARNRFNQAMWLRAWEAQNAERLRRHGTGCLEE